MTIKLFDIENGIVIPTEHCYTLSTLKDPIMKPIDQNTNKKIYVPSVWFGPSGEYNWEDIYVDSWIKINVTYSEGKLIF